MYFSPIVYKTSPLSKIKKINTFSDEELLEKYKQSNDKVYFGEFYKRHTQFIFTISFKYLKNEDDCKDLVMELFEKLLEEIKKHKIENIKKWLYTVTKNQCLMKLRSDKTKREKQHEYEKESVVFMESHQTLHPGNENGKEKELVLLEQAVEQLEEKQKKCIELFFLHEKSYNEVVEITGFTMKKVKSYLQNGKRNLKLYLQNRHCLE